MKRLYFWIIGFTMTAIVLMTSGYFNQTTWSDATASPPPSPPTPSKQMKPVLSSDYQLIDIQTIAPGIPLDIRYATDHNFLKVAVYPRAKCLLRKPVAEALKAAQADLQQQGLSLKLYDCYRPFSVQKAMWKILPDGRYVANPAIGSKHNRGAAVDLTMVNDQGEEVEMPTEFDDFSDRAGRDSQAMSPVARRNVEILTQAMEAQGFTSIRSEWWHYDAPNWQRFGVLNQSL